MVQKTNAMRILEKEKVLFHFLSYPVDENDLSGEHVAETLGLPPEQVFKTLVLKGDNGEYFVCCIPANAKIDLKKAAKISGHKSAVLLPVKELLHVTGYIRGGCSPVGMKKQFPTFIDETAILYEKIIVSAGMRGGMVEIQPEALTQFLTASYADILHNA